MTIYTDALSPLIGDISTPQIQITLSLICNSFNRIINPHMIPRLTQVVPNIRPLPFRDRASPLAHRSFCSNCGSSLAFNYNSCPEVTEIYHWSLDEELLCGKKVHVVIYRGRLCEVLSLRCVKRTLSWSWISST
jgi:hypothetical protein